MFILCLHTYSFESHFLMVLELFTFNMLGIILYGKEEYNHHYLSRNKLITLRYGHKFMDSSYKVCSWGTSDESGRLCTLCPKQVCESKYHTLIQCSAFDHAFHISSTGPNPCTKFSHNHNVHSRWQHSLVKLLNIESHYSLSHVSREM